MGQDKYKSIFDCENLKKRLKVACLVMTFAALAEKLHLYLRDTLFAGLDLMR